MPAASAASSGAARHAVKDEAGFQGRLREALDMPAPEEKAAQEPPQAKPAERPFQEAAKPEAEAAASHLSAAGEKTADAPAEMATKPEAEAAASLLSVAGEKTADAPAEMAAPEVPSSTPLVSAAALPQGALSLQAATPLVSAAVLPQGAWSLQAVTPQLAQEMPGGQPASVPATGALTPNGAAQIPLGEAEAEAKAQPVLTPSAQALASNLAGHGTPEGAEAQQESLVAALATAPGQMAAQQAGQTPQTPSSTRKGAASAKDNAIAARDNVAQFEKQATSAALLAQALATTEAAPGLNIIMAAEGAEARFSLVSLEAAKPAGTKTSGEGRADGLALQAPGFALPDGTLQRTDAPLTSAVARDMPAPPPARQLAPVVVSLVLGRGDEALTISLDPGELGRVEVSIGQGKDAGQVRIVAERPETLALLQRDQRELDRALTQAGLGDVARSLSFSLASDQGRQQHHGAAHQGGQRFPGQATGLEAERPLAPISNQARSATSLLDIAV
jgi:Meckel syndrome type 1 protein